ncbi:MAG: outer membrane beta-barrel protein [Kiritimatiellae bacterium]|nr:outer membrane beta-barrel protein [Kiritimatiellia bacterium]MDW8458737.1 outer membrane beta-barrel protein [Verrucomicrobiota bacterium]
MKWIKSVIAGSLTAAILCDFAAALTETAQNIQLKNRLRVGWDNNVYEEEREEDRDESFKLIEEIELLLNFDFEQSFFGLRYRPSFVWWTDREPDDTDFHHELDLVLAHNFTPRLSLNAKNTMRLAEIPELIDRGSVVRENDDYTYNLTDAVIGYRITEATRVELGGRYTILRYDENEERAKTDDYDITAVGVTLRHQWLQDTAVSADLRLENTEYIDTEERSSESVFYGVGLEQIFSPNLVGSVRGGIQDKSFDSAQISDEQNPFGDLSLTYLPSPKTRITLGAGYSMFEPDVFPFASQDRLLSYLTIGHDISARLQLFLATSLQLSDYSQDQTLDDPRYRKMDGEETVWQASGRVSYMINRKNYLELGVQYLDFSTDLRDEFDRTRVEVGWRTQL